MHLWQACLGWLSLTTFFYSVFLLCFTCPGNSEETHILKLKSNVLNSGFSRRPWLGLALLPLCLFRLWPMYSVHFMLHLQLAPGRFLWVLIGVFLYIYPHKSMCVAIQDLKNSGSLQYNKFHPHSRHVAHTPHSSPDLLEYLKVARLRSPPTERLNFLSSPGLQGQCLLLTFQKPTALLGPHVFNGLCLEPGQQGASP